MNKFCFSFILATLALYLNSCTLDEAVCEKDGHLYGDICEPESVEHCGSHDKNCYNFPGIKDAMCVYRQCIAIRCQTGYHIDNTKTSADITETSDTSDIVCIQDNESTCGLSQINCTETVTGWKTGICSEGVCKPTACQPNYHISSNQTSCEPDDAEHCGSLIENCLLRPGWQSADCEDGKCKLIQCTSGYQPSANNDTCIINSCEPGFHLIKDQSECAEDDINHCGSYNNDCTVRAGWFDGECHDGQCVVTRCNTMYYMLKDNNDTVCLPNTNDHCGAHNKACPSDKPLCTYDESLAPTCATVCDNGLTLCDNGCYDTMTSVTHCGTDTVCGVDCTVKHPDANVDCVAGSCVITTCKTGYHLNDDKSACVQDTIDNCGGSNCNASIPSNAVVSSCNQGQCLYECKEGYMTCDGVCISLKEKHLKSCGVCESGYDNCDLNNQNGCETNLDEYGLKSCSTCASPYMGCGNTTTKLGLVIPLCLAQGNYYKNYEGDAKEQVTCFGDTKFEYYKYYLQNVSYSIGNGPLIIEDTRFCYDAPLFINYEYKEYDVQTGFNKAHYYKLMKNKWNDEKFTWTAEHCALACNSNRNITGDPNGKHTDANGQTIEAWSHQCAPKQACDQFDSFELSLDTYNNNHFFFDYGCQY